MLLFQFSKLGKGSNALGLAFLAPYRLPPCLNLLRNCHKDNYEGLNTWDEDFNPTTKFKIEDYWKNKIKYPEFDASKEDSKFYVLSMFPYPSGNLHMGHIRVYSISDTLARFHRMNGKNVLHPIGWDAFGLPAENAAMERNLSSETWTKKNIATMREQLKQLCCTFNWSRELATCDKEYYKFTQFIFLKMHEQGLVYQRKALVNWDPVDKTVLADEQVDDQGRSWRSGARVEKKILKQWFIRTTSFAKALYDGLSRKDLEDWRDIVDMQKQWIGECNGVSFEFPLQGQEAELTLWTDKPESLIKAKFIAVLPNSILDRECEGSGERTLPVKVINTLTGKPLPVYVTEKLPVPEGSDGRVGIPDVYECDYAFAKSVGIPFSSENEQESAKCDRESVIDRLKGRVVSSKLRDWLISRQRHWGTPIPMVNCGKCGTQPVPYDKLPVELPPVHCVSEKGSSVVSEEWLSTTCPKCGGPATRDRDTMDTFVDSSWYYLRYLDPHNSQEPFRPASAKKLMPVDIYIGGKEHAVLHLYYARFLSYFLHSLGWLPDPEPFKRLVVQGMILGKTYKVKATGKYIPTANVDFSGIPVEKGTGQLVAESWDKMSKSKHNGVDPREVFQEYGVDTTRLLVLAGVAPVSPRNWDKSMFPGVLNWQRKLWLTVKEFRRARLYRDSNPSPPPDLPKMESRLRELRNFHLRAITVSYRVTHQLNQVVAHMQGLTGDLRNYTAEHRAHSVEYARCLAMMVVTLHPLAPHFSAELWAGLCSAMSGGLRPTPDQEFCWDRPVHLQSWPEIDSDHLLQLTCMVNSAIKDTIKLPREKLDQLTESSATQQALRSPQVREYTDQTPVTSAELKLYPGLHATIHLTLDHTKLHFHKDRYKKVKKDKRAVK